MITAARLLSVCVLFAAAQALAQDRRPLTHDDYDGWKALRAQTYTQDGSWVAFQIEPQQGDGVLEIKQVVGDRIYRHDFASGARFSVDGRFALFTVGKSKVEEREKKLEDLRKKAKEANQPASEARGGGEAAAEGAPRRGGAGAGPGGPGAGFAGRGAGGRRGGAGGGAPGAGAGAGGGAGGDGEAATRDRGEWTLLELASGQITKLGKLKAASFSDDLPYLFVHKEKPEAKPAANDAKGEAAKEAPKSEEPKAEEPKPEEPKPEEPKAEEPKPAEPGEAGASKPAEGAPAAGGRGRRGAPSDPLEAKRPEGTELVIRDLATGSERTIADVVAFGTSRHGRFLWYHTSAKQPAKDATYGLFVQPLAGGDAQCLLDGIAHVGGVQFDRAEQCVTFTSDKVTFGDDKPVSDIYLWEGAGAAKRIAWPGGPGMPPGKRPAGGASFTRDGWLLTFDVQDAPAPEPLPILPEDKVTLDLWNWRDGLLQTVQQKRGAGERNPQWTAVYHRQKERLAVLGDDTLRSLRPIGPEGKVLLGNDGRAYEAEQTWDGRYADVWLVDSATGQRTRLLEKYRGNVSNSPGGRWLLWFDANYHWQAYELATGKQRDLTGALGVPFHNWQDDHPEPDNAYGIAGWTETDDAVLLYDEFDVWRIDLGTGNAVCVTDGHGRQNRLRLRIQPLPRDDDKLGLDDELLLTATHVDTMAEGFFADSLSRQQRPQKLLMADKNFGDVARPKRSSRLFFTQGTFAEFPDLWSVAADFSDARRLSDANPQQKQFRWGKAELVHWIDGDGQKRQGVLVKPDDFDPTKKYPMLVYFYERMTQGLHNHVPPAPGTSPNASYYVSNGYLWFMPDVVYEIGYPGTSCVKCVVSGVQHLIAQGFVDEQAIGAAGHSWGGYQTAFLVTRTNIFAAVESGAPVSNMLSAYGGIRYETGMSRQFQYEMTQSRIGGTPWQYPLRYQENSPIWFADKVQTPVLILHNDQDGAVPWTQGIEYFTALRRLGKESYLFNYNGEGHGLRNRANMRDWTRRMAEYFGHHLKREPAPKWMTDGVPFHDRETEKLSHAPSYVDAHVKPPRATKPATEAVTRREGAAAIGDDGAGGGAAVAPVASRAMAPAPAPASKLKVGDAAPEFDLADSTGQRHASASLRGRHVLVWFCPRPDLDSCRVQAEALRDHHAEFTQRGVTVLGVSFADAAANGALVTGSSLPFPLLGDDARAFALACGAADDAQAEMPRRVALLIDGQGKVVKVWSRVNPKTFVEQALAALPL